MPIPQELITVTRTSKIIALLVFILLPVIAFFVGRQYETKTDNPKYPSNVQVKIQPTSIKKDEDHSYLTSLKKQLLFSDKTVVLGRMGSGKIEGTFWEKKIKEIPLSLSIPEKDLITSLYEQKDMNILYYTGPKKDTYYELLPGFARKLVATEAISDYSKKISETSQISCTQEKATLSSQSVIKQTCITTSENPDNPSQTSKSTVANCYMKLNDGTYLGYIQLGNVIDGAYDLCVELENMGVQEWLL